MRKHASVKDWGNELALSDKGEAEREWIGKWAMTRAMPWNFIHIYIYIYDGGNFATFKLYINIKQSRMSRNFNQQASPRRHMSHQWIITQDSNRWQMPMWHVPPLAASLGISNHAFSRPPSHVWLFSLSANFHKSPPIWLSSCKLPTSTSDAFFPMWVSSPPPHIKHGGK